MYIYIYIKGMTAPTAPSLARAHPQLPPPQPQLPPPQPQLPHPHHHPHPHPHPRHPHPHPRHPHPTNPTQPTTLHCLIAGSVSGSASVLCCHAIDVIRTKIQLRLGGGGCTSAAAATATAGADANKVKILLGRIGDLYRGISGPFFAQALYKSAIFASNKVFGSYLLAEEYSHAKSFIAAFMAGTLNSFIVAPIELIRTRQIVSPHRSFPRCIEEIYRKQGLTAFWRALPPTVARDGPGVGLYLLTFEYFKGNLIATPTNNTNINANTTNNTNNTNTNTTNTSSMSLNQPSLFFLSNPLLARLAAGSLAGIAFWVWALPIDTLKTNIEARVLMNNNHNSSSSRGGFRGYLQGLRTVLSDGSLYPTGASLLDRLAFLYRAWPAALLRGIPAAAITLTTFDYMIEVLAHAT